MTPLCGVLMVKRLGQTRPHMDVNNFLERGDPVQSLLGHRPMGNLTISCLPVYKANGVFGLTFFLERGLGFNPYFSPSFSTTLAPH